MADTNMACAWFTCHNSIFRDSSAAHHVVWTGLEKMHDLQLELLSILNFHNTAHNAFKGAGHIAAECIACKASRIQGLTLDDIAA